MRVIVFEIKTMIQLQVVIVYVLMENQLHLETSFASSHRSSQLPTYNSYVCKSNPGSLFCFKYSQ
jgi:hypothetical protein